MKEAKKTIFSGVKPSGDFHLGNYLGAVLNWLALQEKFDSIFCIVDYHAITVKQEPEVLRKNIINLTKTYLAAGIDPKKSVIFRQSDISEHTELAWILNCTATRISDLNKMTQFKDKAGKNQENVSVGLYDYPVLMAADILLYKTEIVPVGDDQVQHVELARTIARRFNQRFGEAFKIPEAVIRKEGARIMGLDNPEKKMSKSAKSELNRIELLDDPKSAMKKIMKATTDLGSEVKYDMETKPGISNLLVIYSLLAKQEIKDLEKKYAGKLYGEFKKDLAEVVAEFLVDFQKKYNQISDETVENILAEGAHQAEPIAEATLARVKKAIGVVLKK